MNVYNYSLTDFIQSKLCESEGVFATKNFQSPIGRLSDHYQTTIVLLSNIYWTSIGSLSITTEHLSNVYQTTIVPLSNIYRTTIYRTTIEHLSDHYQTSFIAPNFAAILQQYYFAELAMLQQYCQSCCKIAAMQPSNSKSFTNITNASLICKYCCKLTEMLQIEA